MVDERPLNVATANEQLSLVFAPWIQELGLRVESMEAQQVVLRLPYAERLCRSQQMVCGQALMAMIDTCMVYVCYAAQGRYGNCTTVSQNTSFMRPVIGQDVLATGRIIKAGRQLVFGEVSLSTAQDARIVAAGTATCMLLAD